MIGSINAINNYLPLGTILLLAKHSAILTKKQSLPGATGRLKMPAQ
jgi:hypothetical protein